MTYFTLRVYTFILSIHVLHVNYYVLHKFSQILHSGPLNQCKNSHGKLKLGCF